MCVCVCVCIFFNFLIGHYWIFIILKFLLMVVNQLLWLGLNFSHGSKSVTVVR